MGDLFVLLSARSAGNAMLWSPPKVISLGWMWDGGEPWEGGRRERSSRKADSICVRAKALEKGVMGMSPQSRIVAQFTYGFRPARWLKER